MGRAEVPLDLLAVEVEGRRHDVAWRLVAELDDIFAKVGLDRLYAGLLQRGVQRDLLRHHGFALGDGFRARLAAQANDDLARLRRIARPMDMAAGFENAALILFEIDVEMGQHMVLDFGAHVAQLVELGQRGTGLRPLDHEAGFHIAERAL